METVSRLIITHQLEAVTMGQEFMSLKVSRINQTYVGLEFTILLERKIQQLKIDINCACVQQVVNTLAAIILLLCVCSIFQLVSSPRDQMRKRK
jgi:hypothetical protein